MKKLQNSQQQWTKIAIISYILIITLNTSGLNYLIKRQSGWMAEKQLYVAYMKLTSDLTTHIGWMKG